MKLVLTLRAEADVDDIAAYIHARHPQGARRVAADLQAAFELIAAFPSVGPQARPGVLRFPLPRYPYLVFYGIDEATQTVRVFTVRHAARRGED